MPRQTLTKNYINQEELDRQLGGLVADTSGKEHAEAVHAALDNYNNAWSAKVDSGHATQEEIDQQNLMHRINAMTQPEHHDDRYDRLRASHAKLDQLQDEQQRLNYNYRQRKIDDVEYWAKRAEYKEQIEALEKEL